jgi:hypothetical protein
MCAPGVEGGGRFPRIGPTKAATSVRDVRTTRLCMQIPIVYRPFSSNSCPVQLQIFGFFKRIDPESVQQDRFCLRNRLLVALWRSKLTGSSFTAKVDYYYYYYITITTLTPSPITVAARSNAWTVFDRSNAGVVGSNPTQGMDVRVRLFCVCVVLCVDCGLATGWSPVQGDLPTVYRLRNKIGQGPQGL